MGGGNGLRDLAYEVLGETGEVVISKEAEDYRPEWQWLVGKERVKSAEGYRCGDRPFPHPVCDTSSFPYVCVCVCVCVYRDWETDRKSGV